jgi:competence protein ComEC
MNLWRLRTSVHSSWLIAVLCLGIIGGVIGLPYVPQGMFGSASWIILAIVVMIVGMWRHRAYVLPAIFIAGCLIGLWRGDATQRQLAPYEKLIGHQLTISGKVTEDADIGKNDELVLRVKVLAIDSHDMTGSIWVSMSTNADIKRGDIVTVKGKLAEGFGSFAGSIYRASLLKVQRPQPGDIARQVRDQFADSVRAAVPEPQASLGVGYLVGQRRSLPPELSEALQIAGLTHVIVASGYNLTILVRLARRLFIKVSKYLAALSAAGMIISFIAITGVSPSMSRAGLVAGLSLLAWYYGRKFHPLVLLPFAAAVTLLINPSYGWNDLGWQLSFAAFAGVMIVAPLGHRYLFGDEKPKLIRQILGETIAAQIVTLPILVMAFGQFSNVAIVANLLILPLVPLAMMLTFVTGIGALVAPSLAMFIGVPVTLLLQYMTSVASYLAGLPWAQSELVIGLPVVGLYYFALLTCCLYIWRKTKYSLRDSNIIE